MHLTLPKTPAGLPARGSRRPFSTRTGAVAIPARPACLSPGSAFRRAPLAALLRARLSLNYLIQCWTSPIVGNRQGVLMSLRRYIAVCVSKLYDPCFYSFANGKFTLLLGNIGLINR